MVTSLSVSFANGFYFVWVGRVFVEEVRETCAPDALPRSARRYFEQETRRLEAMGFVYLGDVTVIDWVRVPVRLFLNADGECVATPESLTGQTAYNFMSIAADGTLLHTVSVYLERNPNTPLPSRCQWSATKDIAAGYSQHVQLVVGHSYEIEAPCLSIDPEYVTGVMDYAHRIAAWSHLERGGTKKRLPTIPRAEQLTSDGQGRRKFMWQARPNNIVFARDRLDALRAAQSAHVATPICTEEPNEMFPLEIG
jgi:hypothetical protein